MDSFFFNIQMKILTISEKLYINVKTQFLENNVLVQEARKPNVLVAVSGGADSMVLLHLLNSLSTELEFNVFAITINHNIREEKESLADVLVVKDFCTKLKINLKIFEYEKGFIENLKNQRKNGIEEAARFCRYKAFSEYASEINADCICLAHNRNDNLETIFQRFLQGSILKCGIQKKRDIYFRPLINVSRKEIEEYAFENNIKFCTDSTNLENKYYRNKIRNQLFPLLDANFLGWESNVLSFEKKMQDISKLIENLLMDFTWQKEDEGIFSFDFEKFSKLDKVLKINLLYKGLENLYENLSKTEPILESIDKNVIFKRFPYHLLESFVSDYHPVNSGNIFISKNRNFVFIEIGKKLYNNVDFYTIIDKVGLYDLPFGKVEIQEKSKNRFVAKLENSNYVSGKFLLPVVIRSKDDSDFIEDKNKNNKDVSKIFSEWKVSEEMKKCIPVFYDEKLRGLWGEPFGFENFFVKIDEDL